MFRSRIHLPAVVAALLLGTAGTTAYAAPLQFDQNVTPDVIFGSGNSNGSFTVDQSNGVELGLRGKLRFNAANSPENTFNSNGDGTYSFDAGQPAGGGFGFAPGSSSTAVWNFEWSVNSDFDGSTGNNLDGYTYQLGVDFDSSQGTDFLTFDLINDPATGTFDDYDHGIGDNSTGNGGGTDAANKAQYINLIANNNVAQNSWNMEFFDSGAFPFDANVDGTYNIFLEAFDGGGNSVARTDIQIIAGAGGSPVPEPASLAVWGITMLGAGGFGWKRRKKLARS